MDNRDDLTRSLFNQDVELVCSGSQMFEGRVIDASLAARLTGALDGSRIEMAIGDSTASFVISHPFMVGKAERVIHYDHGRTWMENQGLCIKERMRNCGIGARMLAQQVFTAKEFGMRRIVMPAAGGLNAAKQLDSELAWLKFGFISNLPFDIRARFSLYGGQFGTIRTLQELVAVPGGAKWWEENGHPFRMEFDVTEDSYSWSMLLAYLRRKGIVMVPT
ncbi:hypothetical protein FNU76_04160 [Chitinimonas arctica]|uniref:Uncharacterized protein n=1 Tax=Chitinimonas arctica TaxID=2594795 RepID=A0A516SBT6_9NEIS|nr:hypothetical protein [Chitinimonas arctica]QDQ25610.1 hypothetical protein FNU76_04160 [Chitinimonas arctica]